MDLGLQSTKDLITDGKIPVKAKRLLVFSDGKLNNPTRKAGVNGR